MPAFDPSVLESDDDLGFELLYERPAVTMFWRPSVLEETCTWLTEHGYRLMYADAGNWRNKEDMCREVASRLGAPDDYGGSLDALDECLWEVAQYDHGHSPESTGLVLVLSHFDAFARAEPRAAHVLLDIFACQSRFGALIGHRMICLIQSDDPELEIQPIGAASVSWNHTESSNASRGV